MSDSRRQTLRQFLRFAVIGTGGLVVDASTLHAGMHGLGLDPYSGRLLSWLVAATFTWAMNRRFTFVDRQPPLTQWAKFLAANAVGGIINYGVYAALVVTSPLVAAYPTIGVGAGSIAGLGFNFSASKWVVFRARRKH
ncbi:MAG: GtrA family protein [Rhodospirillaceae bacterium]|nr:MAG: GtrA family protein [Rhodospirillaceae bacterium]